ncbi:MAG: GNAT family N-acetyltransferase [Pseudonocardia sp.]
MSHDVQVLDDAELRAANDLFAATIQVPRHDDAAWDRARRLADPGRTIGVREGGAVVATACAFASRLAVPGGASLPMAAVTRVGVRADRTRRGLLTAMMRSQLADVVARGEAVATLRASQAGIYGRFGYGVATRGRSLGVRRAAGWRDDAPPGGTVRLVARDEALSTVTAVHDRIALRRPGGITRPAGWWDTMLSRQLTGNDHILVAVHSGPDGDDGFVIASIGQGEDWERRPLAVDDLHAAGPPATAGLWRFLLEVDLVGTVTGHLRPLDESVELMLADRRDCTVTGVGDETWLRLVDVPAALAARAFPAGEPVLVGVHDRVLPANTGVYRVGDGPAQRAHGTPHLECSVDALSMAYLGDTVPSALAAAGWWTVHDRAALARADVLFATSVAPWCGTFF